MHRTVYMGVLACFMALQLAACSRQSAEEKGKEMATEKVDMAKGIGDVLQDKGTAAAESVTAGMGKVLKGVERGLEKSGRYVTLSEAASQAGLQATKVQLADSSAVSVDAASASAAAQGDVPGAHGIEVYLLSERDVSGSLKVKVFNSLDQEIGRSRVAFKQGLDEGRYVRIPLDRQIELQAIHRVDLDFVPSASTP